MSEYATLTTPDGTRVQLTDGSTGVICMRKTEGATHPLILITLDTAKPYGVTAEWVRENEALIIT